MELDEYKVVGKSPRFTLRTKVQIVVCLVAIVGGLTAFQFFLVRHIHEVPPQPAWQPRYTPRTGV